MLVCDVPKESSGKHIEPLEAVLVKTERKIEVRMTPAFLLRADWLASACFNMGQKDMGFKQQLHYGTWRI